MAAATPMAIGTRGNIRSLLRKEIEYFSNFELEQRESSWKPQASTWKPQASIVDMSYSHTSSAQSRPWHGFWFLTMTWKRKKKKKSKGSIGFGFLPSICSMLKVAESSRRNRRVIPGYHYSILKDDDAIDRN